MRYYQPYKYNYKYNVSSNGDHLLVDLQPAVWEEGHEDPHGRLGRRRQDNHDNDNHMMIHMMTTVMVIHS